MSYVTRWKEETPKNTITKVKSFLKEHEIEVEEVNKTNSKGCYALTLILKDTNLFVNGKGTTLEYATASAYGELMERISTLVLFRYNHKGLTTKDEGPIYINEELFLTSEEYYSDNVLRVVSDYNISYEEALAVQEYFTSFNEKLIAEELTHLVTGEKKLFPISITDILYGTNGMSYGNTLDEAKVQALSEVFERYANREIVRRRLTPPVIENVEELLNPELYSLIEGIQGEEFTFKIMDAGIGLELPVICVIFEHIPSNRYYVKFGAHFDINIAVERCFTELFQGRNINDLEFLKEKVYVDDLSWQETNLESILHNGDGYYPLELFKEDEYSYPKKQWGNISSNSEGVKVFEALLKSVSKEVYFKDYSHHGHHVVRYLVEGISEIHIRIDQKIAWQINIVKIAAKLKNLTSLAIAELREVISFIESSSSREDVTLIPYFRHPIKLGSRYRYLNLILLRFVLAVKEKDREKALIEVEKYGNLLNKNENIEASLKSIVQFMEQPLSEEKYNSLVEVIMIKIFKFNELEEEDFCQKGECYCSGIARNYKKIKEVLKE